MIQVFSMNIPLVKFYTRTCFSFFYVSKASPNPQPTKSYFKCGGRIRLDSSFLCATQYKELKCMSFILCIV